LKHNFVLKTDHFCPARFYSAFKRISSSFFFMYYSSIKSARSNKKFAKWSIASSGTFLHNSIRPSVKWGTTLSIKYYLIGWDLRSSKFLSWFLIYSILTAIASSFTFFSLANLSSRAAFSSASFYTRSSSCSSFLIIKSISSIPASSFCSSTWVLSVDRCSVKLLRNLISASVIRLMQHGLPFCSQNS
jgi:hypothetical protein